MSLMLAPYNSAMRLGMGFNSYTQSMCINDVVQKPTGKASEGDLQGKPLQEKPNPNASNSGSQVIQRYNDGKLISQTVTWEAKFVDKISEVTDSMNISGSLAIKVDAIGGGAAAEGHFLDAEKFKESDLNYFIQVKVTNQQLIADDVTQFAPVRNVQAADFTNVYGDSYIAGFLEGGVFNAVVSVKLKDKTKKRDIGGSLAVKLDLKVVQVEGKAQGGKETEDTSSDAETTISVSWSGGGDIKPDSVTDWDIPSLKRVAMEFPDLVSKCPQRTYAVINKYTGLRSFYEQNLKGSPLDYENAGVYTSALLDAYMDYKSMWKSIQTTTWEVDNHLSQLVTKASNPDIQDLAARAKADFDKREKKYLEDSKAVATPGQPKKDIAEEPLEPNPIVPYKGSIYGLDQARRDCRFEMIKIVREVDAVMLNPQVAVDPNRAWQYLSPVVFRQLLPSVTSVKLAEQQLDAAETKRMLESVQQALDNSKTAQDQVTEDLRKMTSERDGLKNERDNLKLERDIKAKDSAGAQGRIDDAQKKINDVTNERDQAKQAAANAENKVREISAQLDQARKSSGGAPTNQQGSWGSVEASRYGWSAGRDARAVCKVPFDKTFSSPPRLLFGLSFVDMEQNNPRAVSSRVTDTTTKDFTMNTDYFAGAFGWGFQSSWLTLPENDMHLERGMVHTYDAPRPMKDFKTRVFFDAEYKSPPKICVWFQEIFQPDGWTSLKLGVDSVGQHGFQLTISSWADRTFQGARVGWFAYPAEEDGKRVRSGRENILGAQGNVTIDRQFGGAPFSRVPTVFFAISEFDFAPNPNLRCRSLINSVTTSSMNLTYGTWADTVMNHAGFTWIAIE